MLGCPSYLDSSNLADLRELFSRGVHRSEVLLLLLSENVLTRPWFAAMGFPNTDLDTCGCLQP